MIERIRDFVTDILCMVFILIFGMIVAICIPEDELYPDEYGY